MSEIKFNEKMYYPCSVCGSRNNPKWHKPGTKLWQQHLNHIDVDEINSTRPSYFWCTKCNKPHHLNRKCLEYKATIIINGSVGISKKSTKLNHNDTLFEINELILQNTNLFNWKAKVGTRSLPWPTTRRDRLVHPDLIYCKSSSQSKFGYSITHVVEFETATSDVTIADKVERFNKSFEEMVFTGAQEKSHLPKIVFIYDDDTNISVSQVRKSASKEDQYYLKEVTVDYNRDNWFVNNF